MRYKHIPKEEHRIIEELTQTGSSNKKIAEELGGRQARLAGNCSETMDMVLGVTSMSERRR